MLFKDFQIKAPSIDQGERIVEGYASTWDKDQVDDVIERGAFKKSIAERFAAGKIKVLWQHSDAIGVPVEMTEDDKGLYVKARISNTALGDEALTLAADGVVDRFSVGFMIPEGKAYIREDGTRVITEVKLMEFSLVTFAANEEAILTAVKALRGDTTGAAAERVAKALEDLKNLQPREAAEDVEPLSSKHNDEAAPAGHSVEDAKGIEHSIENLANFARLRVY